MLAGSVSSTFTLDAGTALLDVTLSGAGYEGIEALVGSRLAEFVDPDSRTESAGAARARIGCAFELASTEWLSRPGERPSIEPVAVRDGADWEVHWPFYDGRFGPECARARLARHAPSLEHALRGAAVFGTMPDRGLFFHAATLVYGAHAWLVAGHPNAGKSTIAREGGADRVLSNEISIVLESSPGAWVALPSPFWGTGDVAHRAEPAPLGGIAVLTRSGDANRWEPLRGGRAVAALMPHVACQAAAQLADGAILRRVTDLAGAVPSWSLAWYRPSHPLEGLAWSR